MRTRSETEEKNVIALRLSVVLVEKLKKAAKQNNLPWTTYARKILADVVNEVLLEEK